MIKFQPLGLSQKKEYDRYLTNCGERGCEYSFANLYLWGRQRAAIVEGCMVLFSQFTRRSVYPFPIGPGDKKAALDAIIHDAKVRDIPCRLTSLTAEDQALLENNYPGRFRFHHDRDSYDYVYAIDDLADLKGRKFQRKRNHVNKFYATHPDCVTLSLEEVNVDDLTAMLKNWYTQRLREEPQGDYHMEQAALFKGLRCRRELGMEGLVLVENGQILAFTMGTPLTQDTFDVNFEKAVSDADGAYAAINQAFARYLRNNDPQLKYLNREDDLGLEGLRKAKLSYCPHHMIEKSWACLKEDGCDY